MPDKFDHDRSSRLIAYSCHTKTHTEFVDIEALSTDPDRKLLCERQVPVGRTVAVVQTEDGRQ